MKNFFIERDDGNIVSLFARPQYEGQEFLSEDDSEIISFLEQSTKEIEKPIIDIDEIFEGATTIAGLRAACIKAFKKISIP